MFALDGYASNPGGLARVYYLDSEFHVFFTLEERRGHSVA